MQIGKTAKAILIVDDNNSHEKNNFISDGLHTHMHNHFLNMRGLAKSIKANNNQEQDKWGKKLFVWTWFRMKWLPRKRTGAR